jgi:hypothetical protein
MLAFAKSSAFSMSSVSPTAWVQLRGYQNTTTSRAAIADVASSAKSKHSRPAE